MSGPKAPRKIGPKLAMRQDTVQSLGVDPGWLRSAPPAKRWGALRALRELSGALLLDIDARRKRLSKPSLVARVALGLEAQGIEPWMLGYAAGDAHKMAEDFIDVLKSLEKDTGYPTMREAARKLAGYIHSPRGLMWEHMADRNPLLRRLIDSVAADYRRRLNVRGSPSSQPPPKGGRLRDAGHWSEYGYHVRDETITLRDVYLVDHAGNRKQYVDRALLSPVDPARPRKKKSYAFILGRQDKLPADKLGPQAAKDLARFDEKKIHRIEGRVVRSDGSVDPGVEKFELEDMVWHDDLPGVGVGPDPLLFPGAIVSNVILTPDRSRAYLMIDVGIAKPVFEKMFTCLTAMQDRLGRP